ncbi:glycoside hydrolase family 15 protein [Mycolicibacterium grossiae]|uniref:Glycoside hydrolase family 15 n=1 Tax=Mycolicibacterium grossiae TaxID=1552759 RepID=A0A1E8PZP2_9MYCO|nr:glycoside hydrolase family 15 protein [Mycolicibacterium grossiae]OFJ51785.1 glycoside hydrolase family 15 [Mycolicibacterium grossiae]QEM44947.1 glycoside hydrolase family 15 protein [Mycolicibacterium grossiae]
MTAYGVPPTRPFGPRDGQLPISDHAVLGDGSTCALVRRDGALPWLCVPRFDAPPLFAGLLDARRGGSWSIAPEGLSGGEQRYVDDTAVVITTLSGAGGTVEVTDFQALRSGADLTELGTAARGQLVRVARVVSGSVRLRIAFTPRHGRFGRHGGDWTIASPDHPVLPLRLRSSHPLHDDGDGTLAATVTLRAGQTYETSLVWAPERRIEVGTPTATLLARTERAWRQWATHIDYEGPQRHLVRRSALTLKLLDHSSTGGIMAAATSSLPEWVGGERNWDYRYTWVRDAAFSTYSLRRIGLTSEADAFLAWTLGCAERDGGPSIMYALDGGQPPAEHTDPTLSGWRDSAPVRWGNGAAGQTQHDVYGELLDVAYQWVRAGGHVDDHLWSILAGLADAAAAQWRSPDHGIWEIRDTGRPFTYSVAMCQVAVDRALRIAEATGRTSSVERWRRSVKEIGYALDHGAWDAERGTFTEQLSGDGSHRGGLDGALLALPLRRVVDFTDPRMIATVEAVRRDLDAGDGLLYRYRHDVSSDGLAGPEGAFLLCSFWLVDNLTGQGRIDEALSLYDSLCARANHVGLLSEEIDPRDGSFLGNFPQAFSHIGVIASGHRLTRAMGSRRG